jgi:hypothetical protein
MHPRQGSVALDLPSDIPARRPPLGNRIGDPLPLDLDLELHLRKRLPIGPGAPDGPGKKRSDPRKPGEVRAWATADGHEVTTAA